MLRWLAMNLCYFPIPVVQMHGILATGGRFKAFFYPDLRKCPNLTSLFKWLETTNLLGRPSTFSPWWFLAFYGNWHTFTQTNYTLYLCIWLLIHNLHRLFDICLYLFVPMNLSSLYIYPAECHGRYQPLAVTEFSVLRDVSLVVFMFSWRCRCYTKSQKIAGFKHDLKFHTNLHTNLQWVRIEFGLSISSTSFASGLLGHPFATLAKHQPLGSSTIWCLIKCVSYRIILHYVYDSHIWMCYVHHIFGAEKDALVSHDSLSGSFHVVLPSGRSVILTLSMNSTVSEIRDAAKDTLQVNFLRLMCLGWTCDHLIFLQVESKCNYMLFSIIYIYIIHHTLFALYIHNIYYSECPDIFQFTRFRVPSCE